MRDIHRTRWLADLRQDLAYAARTLRRSPGFRACAVLTPALGIGANTAIFSLIDAVMLQPLPVRNPASPIQVARFTETGRGGRAVSYPLFEYFRDRLSSISGAFVDMPSRGLAIQTATVDLLRSMPGIRYASAAAEPPIAGGLGIRSVRVEGYEFHAGEDDSVAFNAIAPNFFAVTGTPLLLGRDFNERDVAGSKPVAIVNQLFARAFFGGQPPLGHHVETGDTTYEIASVVGDAKYEGLRAAMPKTAYIPILQRKGGRLAPLTERATRERTRKQ